MIGVCVLDGGGRCCCHERRVGEVEGEISFMTFSYNMERKIGPRGGYSIIRRR